MTQTGSFDLRQVNVEADAYVRSVAQGYRALANPQVFAEAQPLGLAPALSTAAQNADPSYAPVLTATPTQPQWALAQPQQRLPQAQTTLPVSGAQAPPSPDPTSFDPQQYMQHQADNFSNKQELLLGGPPVASTGYVDWMQGRLQAIPDLARAWQQNLQQEGFLDAGHPADGRWDSGSQDALRQMLIARFMPDAVYSQDQATRQKASYFIYSASGQQVNPGSLTPDVLANEDFKHSVVQGWLAANGQKGGDIPRDSISQYADAYGDSALPGGWAGLKSQGLVGNIFDSVGGLANNLKSLETAAADRVPGVGRVADTLAGLISGADAVNLMGNLTSGDGVSIGDYRQHQADAAKAALNGNDQALLGKAVDQVAQSQGFLGQAGDAYSRGVTRLQLATIYSLGDGLSDLAHGNIKGAGEIAYTAGTLGIGANIYNPFDPMGRAISGANLHSDNFLAGLVGDQWVKDHPFPSALVNFTAGLADPTLVLGKLTAIPRFARLAKGVEEAAGVRRVDEGVAAAKAAEVVAPVEPINPIAARRLQIVYDEKGQPKGVMPTIAASTEEPAMGDASRVSHQLSPKGQSYLEQVLRPQQAMAKMISDGVHRIAMNPDHGPDHLAELLDLNSPEQYEKLVDRLYNEDGTRKVASEAEVAAVIRDLAPQLTAADATMSLSSAGTMYNLAAKLKAISRDTRLSSDGMHRVLASGGLPNLGSHFTLTHSQDFEELLRMMRDWGSIVGMDQKEVTQAIAGVVRDKGNRVDLVNQFSEKVHQLALQHTNRDPKLMALGKRQRAAGAEKTSQYAPNPDQASPPGSEMSTIPRDPGQDPNAAAVSALEDQLKELQGEAQQLYEDVYAKSHGGKRAATPQEAADYFKTRRKNADVYAQHTEKFAGLADMIKEARTLGAERAAPMFPSQLANQVSLPFNTYQLLMAYYPKLEASENIARASRLGNFMSAWKLIAIARPSTFIRATLGDDVVRYGWEMSMLGSSHLGSGAMLDSLLAMPRLARNVGGGMVAGVRSVAKEHRLSKVEKLLSAAVGPDEVKAIRKGAGLKELSSSTLTSGEREMLRSRDAAMEQMIGDQGYSDTLGFNTRAHYDMTPDMPGHRDAFEYAVHTTFNTPAVREWAKAESEAERKKALWSWLTGSDPGAKLMREARQMTAYAKKYRDYHAQQAQELQAQLRRAVARSPKDPDAWEFRELPRNLEAKGTARQQAEAKLAQHQARSQSAEAAMRDYVDQMHGYLTEFGRDPQVRRWMAGEPVDQQTLDAMYRDPLRRSLMPKVVGRRPDVHTDASMGGPVGKAASHFVGSVFTPMVAGARAYGAERMRKWLTQWAKERYPGWATEKTASGSTRLDAWAIGKTRQWMRNNTYQSTRTVGDLALRNAFPFVGATMSMDRFWMRQVAAHPWMAGQMFKMGAKADQAAQDHFNVGFSLPFGMFGGHNELSLNPAGVFFFSNDGFGSLIPGQGPWLTAGTSLIRKDPTIDAAFNNVPGYESANVYSPTIAPGALSTLLNLGSDASVAAGGPSLAPGVLGGSSIRDQATFDKRVDEKMRQLSESGQAADVGQARKDVAEEMASRDLLGALLPISPSISDPLSGQLAQARTQYNAASDEAAKVAVLTANPEAAPLLAYTDPTVDGGTKDAIEEKYPWVIPYSQSLYESRGMKATSLQDFQDGLAHGSIHVMNPDEYHSALLDQYQISQGFTYYREHYLPLRAQFDAEIATLQQQGVSSTDPTYAALQQERTDTLSAIQNNMRTTWPSWANKFDTANSAERLSASPHQLARAVSSEVANSMPISSLTAYSLLPMVNQRNDPLFIALQHVVLWKDMTAETINSLQDQGATQDQVDAAAAEFKTQVQGLEQQYPELRGVLDSYHFGRYQDFLSLGVRDVHEAVG